MQVVCISRGTLGRGIELAESTSKKLGYACVSREELVEAAIKDGIQVGKLEMTMLKPQAFSERLAIEKEHYLAFCTAYLCDRASEENLVYHGRTGHLLLPGVSHVLRVRVVCDTEQRILAVMDKMGLERRKASNYVEQVDEDRKRWAKSMYDVSGDEVINFDVVVNLQQMSLENTASALTSMAQLPDFQMTPASEKTMADLGVGAKARLALARDERTSQATFKVRADSHVVTVSYLPQDSKLAEYIPEVVLRVPGITQVRTTMAMTNILWIEEEYRPHSDTFEKVVEIATKWNAAVELMRLASDEEGPSTQCHLLASPIAEAQTPGEVVYNAGIEDDTPDVPDDDRGLRVTLDELARVGRSGGGSPVYGGRQRLVEMLGRHIPYTLVVIGNVFLSKGHAARLRATRDLSSFLSDHIKAPVVTADEIGSQYLFGKRDVFRTAGYVTLVAAIYWLVFTHQEWVLAFLADTGWYAEATEGTLIGQFDWLRKLIVAAAVTGIVPVIAITYGKVAAAVLKWIKME